MTAAMEHSEIMRRVKSQNTAPELALRKALHAAGLRYRVADKGLPGKPDIVLPRGRLVVFIDGDYWHGGQWRRRGRTCLEEQFSEETKNRDYWLQKIRRNMARDFKNTAELLADGWRVARIWESDLEQDLDGWAQQIVMAAQEAPVASAVGASCAWSILANRTVAEYFAGIGFVRLGLDREGWETVFANDIDKTKRRIYELNFRDTEAGSDHFVQEDIHRLPVDSIPQTTLATASFPCTDLSLAGGRRGLKGSQSGAFWGFVRLLEEQGDRRPPLILLENVQGFLTSHGGTDFYAAMRALSELGYYLDVFVLNASYFTPQSRPRLFVFGSRDAAPPVGPVWDAHTLDSLPPSPLRPPNLMRALKASPPEVRWRLRALPTPASAAPSLSAIAERDLPDGVYWPQEKAEKLIGQMNAVHVRKLEAMQATGALCVATVFRRMRQGRTHAEIRDDGLAGCLRTPRGGSSNQIVLEVEGSRVRVRWLTPLEGARLQGAPDTFHFPEGKRRQALFGVGDAVCVPVIEWIARYVITPAAVEALRGRILTPHLPHSLGPISAEATKSPD